jgi:glutamate-1-semialdehyde 2,1-aminomutase
LKKVRELASKHGIVLIFDECTSGFRQAFGGLHIIYGVEPDMAVFGKAMGNGYAITAIIGRREIMEFAQTTFISSTFWTERIGPSAAVKTLEVMEKMKSWDLITETGLNITEKWKLLGEKYNLPIKTAGLSSITSFGFNSKNMLAYKTLITQEMLAKGYLAGNLIFVSTEHSKNIISGYFDALDPIFSLIGECENGRDVNTLLKGPVCHGGFNRLN